MLNLIPKKLILHRPFHFHLEFKYPRFMIIFFLSGFKTRSALLQTRPSERNKGSLKVKASVQKKVGRLFVEIS